MKSDELAVTTEPDEERPSGAGRALLIILTLWALAMIAPGLQRVFDSLDSFGLYVDNDGVVTDVTGPFRSASDSPASVAGIHRGDRIDLQAMRCIPVHTPECASLIAVLGGLGGMQSVLPHSQIALVIKPSSGGPFHTAELESAPAPLDAAERIVLLADTLVGMVVIIIGFWLVWTRPGWMTWGLFLYIIWINPGQSSAYYALLQRWPAAVLAQEIAEALAQGAAFAGLVIFALRFPEDRIEAGWQKAQKWVALFAAAMSLLTLLCFANLFGFHTEIITEASFLLGYAVDVAVLLILLKRRHTLPPPDRQRMLWVIWGCAIGLPSYIFAELCQSASLFSHLLGFSPSQTFIGLLYLPNGVLAYLASQAVWQRRVVSVGIPLRRATILAALSLAVGVPIFQLHEKLAHVQESIQLAPWFWALVVAPVILVVLQRLHETMVEGVDRVFNRKFHVARRELEQASEAIVHAQSLGDIDRLLVESTVQTLRLSSGAVFRNDKGVFRRKHHTKGWEGAGKKELRAESDAPALHCLKACAPVRLHLSAEYALELPAGVEAPCLSVPVQSEIPEAKAIVLFGPHETGNEIDPDECELLNRIAGRAAAGYEHVITLLLRREVARLKAELAAIEGGDRKAQVKPN